ncbi:MAG: hypothetical protein DRR16_26865, partial [Candidatus Parabeggiatoa sp. nov. 3]
FSVKYIKVIFFINKSQKMPRILHIGKFFPPFAGMRSARKFSIPPAKGGKNLPIWRILGIFCDLLMKKITFMYFTLKFRSAKL